MAKLQTYKFVNPGVSNVKSPIAAAAKKQTLALNRLGSTISGIGSVVSDIEKISIAQIKNEKLRERAERRRERREADQAAEEAIENKKATRATKPKISKTSLKIVKGSLSWIEKFLAPIGKFFGYLAKIAISTGVLDWVSNPDNINKLTEFLEKTHFVFKKLFGWAAGFTNNILDGFSALSDPNSTFIQRLGAIGTIMKGFIGLKYLMNPFSLIGDILSLIDLLTGTDLTKKGRNRNQRGTRGRTKGRPGTRGRPKITTSKGKSTGPLRGIREFFRNTRKFLGKKTEISVGGAKKSGNFFTNLFKGKNVSVGKGGAKTGNFLTNLFKGNNVSVGKGGVKGNFFSNLFKGKAPVTEGVGGKSGNFFSNLFKGSNVTKGQGGTKSSTNFLKNLFKFGSKIKVSPSTIAKGVATAGGTVVVDIAANALVSETINKPLGKLIDNNARRVVENRFLELGSDGAIKYYQDIIDRESAKTPIPKWADVFGIPSIFIGPDKRDIVGASRALNYIDELTSDKSKQDLQKKLENPKKKTNFWSGLFSKNKPKKSEPEKKKKKGLFGLGFLGLKDGGELQEMGLGGFLRSVGKAFSGVVKGVGKVVGGVVNTVGNIVSNPIVGTALSFIPGMQIPMAVLNAGTALAQGNVMGALSSGLAGLSAFANINTVNAISQPGWLQNLRFSGFGQGVANMYHSGLNAFNNLSAGFNNFMNSKVGSIASDVLSGNYLGALNTLNPKIGGIAQNIISGNYGGALSAFNPELGAAVSKGIALVDSFRQDPMGLLAGVAEANGMGGILKAVTGLFGGGDKVTAVTQIAAEMGVDPKLLGVVDSVNKRAMREGGISAEFAIEQAMEFIPIPVIIEKIVPIPQAVGINIGGGNQIVITAPNSLLDRMR